MSMTMDRRALTQIRHAVLRADLLQWCRYSLTPLQQAPALHHRRLITDLQDVSSGACDRLLIMMPPGSAKSTYASVLFPAWFMAAHPGEPVIGASHTATLAELFSRRVQAQVREFNEALGYGLRTESAERWEATNGSEYRSAGVSGPITGSRALLAVIDDPVKSRADADSITMRDRAWHWFNSDLITRLKPNARIVLIQTRWHEDDLAGRILAVEGERWRVLSLPALAEPGDALGRAEGVPLWGDDQYGYGRELFDKRDGYERAGMMRDWWSLYQQSPRNPEGSLFRIGQIPALEAVPVGGRDVRAWDLAATAQGGDYTVGVRMRKTDEGRFIVVDVVRIQGAPEAVEAAIVNTASQDGRGVLVSIPQDPGAAGVSVVEYLTRKLAGYRVTQYSWQNCGISRPRSMTIKLMRQAGRLTNSRQFRVHRSSPTFDGTGVRYGLGLPEVWEWGA